jgi:hypothetical protein
MPDISGLSACLRNGLYTPIRLRCKERTLMEGIQKYDCG